MSSSGDSQSSATHTLCSAVSSDSTPRGDLSDTPSSPEDEAEQQLLSLLSKPRDSNGYGGFIRFAEFAAMTRQLHWSDEDAEDCWYSILRGVPMAEATDMRRVAATVYSYCLASGYPLPEVWAGSSALVLPSPPSVEASSSKEGGDNVSSSAMHRSDAAVQTHEPVERRKGVSPPRQRRQQRPVSSLASPTSSGRVPRQPRRLPPEREGRGGEDEGGSSATRANAVPKGQRGEQVCGYGDTRSRSSVASSPFKRYTVSTVSSRRKSISDSLSLSACGRCRTSPVRRGRASQNSSAVFTRLYTHAASGASARQKASDTAEAAPNGNASVAPVRAAANRTPTAQEQTATARERAERVECTFKPMLTPYHSERLERERSSRPDCFRRPTRSSLARLLREERRHDPIAEAPATPRVGIRPAPGPPSQVPPGYIEGVARLRLGVAHRSSSPSYMAFTESLREGSMTPTQRVSEERRRLREATATPILRLPLADTGADDARGRAREYIDVWLMTPPPRQRSRPSLPSSSALCTSASPIRRHPTPPPPPRSPLCGSPYDDAGPTARFKAHPPTHRAR